MYNVRQIRSDVARPIEFDGRCTLCILIVSTSLTFTQIYTRRPAHSIGMMPRLHTAHGAHGIACHHTTTQGTISQIQSGWVRPVWKEFNGRVRKYINRPLSCPATGTRGKELELAEVSEEINRKAKRFFGTDRQRKRDQALLERSRKFFI